MKISRRSQESWQSDKYRLDKAKEYFKDTPVRTITPSMIRKFINWRLEDTSGKTTANRYIALLKKMFNFLIEEGHAENNPVKGIKLYPESPRNRAQAYEEEGRLYKECSGYLKQFYIVALNTGMRSGEIRNLKWNQIDFNEEKIKLEKTKSGKPRYAYLNTDLLDLFRTLKSQNNGSPYVWVNPKTGKPYTRISKAWKSACERANIKDLKFHDIRHTFGTRLIEQGENIITVKALLGHSTVKMTERYTHADEKQKREAVENLAKNSAKKSKNRDNLLHHSDICKNITFDKLMDELIIH